MRRRSRAGGEPVKTRRRKAAPLKRRNAPKAVRRRSSSAAGRETKVARLTRELREVLQQQTATADVLKVISRSTFDLQTVLDALIETAARLCEAHRGVIMKRDGDSYHGVAFYNASPELVDFIRRHPITPGRHTITARVALERRTVHVADLQADTEYRYALRDVDPIRTELGVPMFRGDDIVGIVILYKLEVQPFTGKQIELVTTFADQAVIAIENARLFDELRQRTTDLTESLEQQTATSEVLRIISSSPGDLQPVFEAILENATRICEAKFGNLWLREADKFRVVAIHGGSPEYREYLFAEPLVVPDAQDAISRVVNHRQAVQIDDISIAPTYGMRMRIATIKIAKARTLVVVPMLKDNEVVGIIAIYRREVRLFTDKQIELLTNFAAQAVIAIENTRLLNELRQRTDDLTERTAEISEALEQQTATSEVLQVISSSPGDLEPVFATMLQNAVRICDAKFANIYRWEGETMRIVAALNTPPALAEFRRRSPILPLAVSPKSLMGRMVATKAVVHIPHVTAEEAYVEREPIAVAAVELGGMRTVLFVPMLKENELIGAITVYRQEVRPFTDKQIALVTSFASQAVIAVENPRLLNELRESLQQQTATADVLKVISRATFDLQTVLQTLVESAARLCDADKATITRQKGEVFYRAVAYGFSAEFLDYVRSIPIVPERGSVHGRTLLEGKVVHIADVLADPEYTFVEAQRLGDFRTVLGVPMLREGIPIGALALTRSEVRPFTDKQIELVSTFADQAVIAIENVRLFEAEQQRTRELTESLDQQTATSEVLQVISSSPGDLQPVFASMLEKAVRICGAKFGTLYLHEAGGLCLMAAHDVPPGFSEARRGSLTQPAPGGALEGVTRTKRTVQITDLATTQAYAERHPRMVEAVEIGGIRTIVAVPMLKDNELVGVIAIHRREVLPFTDKQIALVTNFAAQAVIAIENARLLNELRQRTDDLTLRTADLTEALEQQTATSDVLKVIPAHPAICNLSSIPCSRTQRGSVRRHTVTCGHSMANKCTPSRCGAMHHLSNGYGSTIQFGQSRGARQSGSCWASPSFMWPIGAMNLRTATIKHFAN